MDIHAEPLLEAVERGQRTRRSKELVWSALSSRRGSTCDLDSVGREPFNTGNIYILYYTVGIIFVKLKV